MRHQRNFLSTCSLSLHFLNFHQINMFTQAVAKAEGKLEYLP